MIMSLLLSPSSNRRQTWSVVWLCRSCRHLHSLLPACLAVTLHTVDSGWVVCFRRPSLDSVRSWNLSGKESHLFWSTIRIFAGPASPRIVWRRRAGVCAVGCPRLFWIGDFPCSVFANWRRSCLSACTSILLQNRFNLVHVPARMPSVWSTVDVAQGRLSAAWLHRSLLYSRLTYWRLYRLWGHFPSRAASKLAPGTLLSPHTRMNGLGEVVCRRRGISSRVSWSCRRLARRYRTPGSLNWPLTTQTKWTAHSGSLSEWASGSGWTDSAESCSQRRRPNQQSQTLLGEIWRASLQS